MKSPNIIKDKNSKNPMHKHSLAKGTIYLMIAQVIFLASGYIIHIGLARTLSSTEYGRVGVILTIMMMSQIFLLTGVPNAITRFVAQGVNIIKIKKKANLIQLIFSIIIFGIVIILAPLLSDILKDEKLSNPIRLISVIIPIRAFLGVYKGILLGKKEYIKSTIVEMMNSVPRIFFVFTFLFLVLELLE